MANPMPREAPVTTAVSPESGAGALTRRLRVRDA
jgi:hypothetical protein